MTNIPLTPSFSFSTVRLRFGCGLPRYVLLRPFQLFFRFNIQIETLPPHGRIMRRVAPEKAKAVPRKTRFTPVFNERGIALDGPMWDFPTMIVTLDAKRRFSIPAKLAPASPGDQFDATFDAEEDAVILRRVPRRKSWLAVMKACPVPMDDLPPRSREMPKKVKL